MADAPAVPPPDSAATAVVASAITANSLRRRDRSGRLIEFPHPQARGAYARG
jgi:hypothetical protein